MGLFDSSGKRIQESLYHEFQKAGFHIFASDDDDAAEARVSLAQGAETVRNLRAQLTEDQYAQAFDRYWRESSFVYQPLFDSGLDRSHVRQILWNWGLTGESPLTPKKEEPHKLVPGRSWTYDPTGASYTYIESLRVNMPEGQNTYAAIEQLGQSLAQKLNRSAFAGVGLDDKGRLITPWWVSAHDVCIHGTGDVTAAGWPTHALFWLPDALDLGAVDGRNNSIWPGQEAPQGLIWPNDHLYIGSQKDSRFEMLRIGGNVNSVDVSRDGSRALFVEHWGGQDYAVGVADAWTGERKYLCNPGSLSGYESARFSPDERWALLDSSRPAPMLIELESGATITLPVGTCLGADWWPALGPSCVGLLISSDEGQRLQSFDLESGAISDYGPLELPPNDLPLEYRLLRRLAIHPTSDVALVGSSLGTAWSHHEKYGGRDRVAHLALTTQRVEEIGPPFIDGDQRLDRSHEKWRWIGKPAQARTVVCDQLRSTAVVSPGGPPTDLEWVAGDVRNLAIFAGKALGHHLDEAARLRTELLRAYEACRWCKDEETVRFVQMIGETASDIVREWSEESGKAPLPPEAVALVTLSREERLIREDQSGQIDWSADSYC
jgi:hypothetical protein